MRDLGLQTAQLIVDAPDPALKMLTLVQSFPAHALAVSSTKLRSSFADDISRVQAMGVQRAVPGNSLYLNGMHYDLTGPTLNLFDVVAGVGAELGLLQSLSELPLSAGQRRRAVAGAVALGASAAADGAGGGVAPVRVDVSKGGKNTIAFMNNLERDKTYKRWPSSMQVAHALPLTLALSKNEKRTTRANVYTHTHTHTHTHTRLRRLSCTRPTSSQPWRATCTRWSPWWIR